MSGSSFACSPDGTRIAYDRCGAGQAITLLHGGGGTRREWHETGYVQRLQDRFTVVTMDLRGHGESDRPTPPSAYTADKMSQDILAVADACRIKRFAMWAMSYGGKVGRYLATRSARVTSLILMGTPLGPGVVGERRQQALDFLTHWHPIIQAQQAGTLDAHSLSDADQDVWSRLHVPSMLGWVRAMLDWPSVEPRDFCCPTLWLVGSEDRHAMDSLREYEGTLQKTQVRVQVASGLDHNQIFDEIDQVYPIMLGFTKSE